MVNTRVTGIGRRLFKTSRVDEKDYPFSAKPGFTWGISIRTKPSDWDLT